MWIVDTALKARADQNRPIRVGTVGAGLHVPRPNQPDLNSTPGMRVVAISNQRPETELIDWRRRLMSNCSGKQL
jgi:predicted homoserine dehydrogenase-like protein